MKILWSSNALWAATGYGVQAGSLLPRLRDAGHEVAQFAWYGVQGGVLHANGIKIYPAGFDQFGSDIIGAHVADFEADVVISLQDIWVLPDDYNQRVKPASWVCWYPVDQWPLPKKIKELALTADYPVTYSKWGQQVSADAGVATHYIPHGVETSIFCPGDKAEARQKLGLPDDAYIVSMVAANKGFPSRKAFPENLLAFAAFRRQHPEAILYLHTLETPANGGVNFAELIPSCGIPREAVHFVDQYRYVTNNGVPPQYMADVYRASDVLLAASMSEGFGIPIIEAQACGCPVITTDATSMSELTVNGIATEYAQRFWTPLDAWVVLPSVDEVFFALTNIYERDDSTQERKSAEGVAVVNEYYDWDKITRDYWLPFLAQVENARAV